MITCIIPSQSSLSPLRALVSSKYSNKDQTYRDHPNIIIIHFSLTSCRPSPAPQAAFIASFCACCLFTVSARTPGDGTLLPDFGRRGSATKHCTVYSPPRCFLHHSQGQDRSHGCAGCGALDHHQHRRHKCYNKDRN